MSPDNVRAANVTSTGTLVATTNGRLLGINFASTSSGGSVVIKDGGASGTTLVTITTPVGAGNHYQELPGAGISFGTDLHATLSNVSGVTVFYVKDKNAV